MFKVKSHSPFVVAVFTFFLLLFLAQPYACGDDNEYRTWTDKSGKHKTIAALVSYDGSEVKLRREDGKLIAMSVDKLSDEDRTFLEQQDDNPFETGIVEDESESVSDDDFSISGKKERFEGYPKDVFIGNTKKAERQNAFSGGTSWNVEPTVVDVKKMESFRSVPVLNSPSIPQYTFPQNKSLLRYKDSKIFYGYQVGVGQNGKTYFELCDVSTGKSQIIDTTMSESKLCDISPDGKRALSVMSIMTSAGIPKKSFLAVTNVEPFPTKTASPFAVFCPFDPDSDASQNKYDKTAYLKELNLAYWVDSERVLSATNQEVTLWNLKTGTAEYAILHKGATLTLAPSRDYFVLTRGSGAAFYSAASGELLGNVDFSSAVSTDDPAAKSMNDYLPTKAAFSPNGARLAVNVSELTFVIDLKSGKIESVSRTVVSLGDPVWANDSYLLVNGSCYEVGSDLPICYYLGVGNQKGEALNAFGLVWNTNSEVLYGAELPHKKALDALAEFKPEESFFLYPGAKVSIKYELNDLIDQKEVESQIKSSLERSGLTYDPKSDIVVVATCRDTGRTEETRGAEIEGRSLGGLILPGRGRVRNLATVDLKVFEQRLRIEAKGKTLFNFGIETTGPDRLDKDSDKPIEELMREANKPILDFYKWPLPKYISKSGSLNALMSATVGPDGVK